MDWQLVYDTFANGADNNLIGGVIAYVLLGAGFAYFALGLRWAQRKGYSLASRSARSNQIRAFIAENANGLITASVIGGCIFAYWVFERCEADRAALINGTFKTMTGTLEKDVVVAIISDHRRSAVVYERDKLIVSDRGFVLSCPEAQGAVVTPIGEEGTCFGLYTGDKLRVDYSQVSPTEYREDPLRIWVQQ